MASRETNSFCSKVATTYGREPAVGAARLRASIILTVNLPLTELDDVSPRLRPPVPLPLPLLLPSPFPDVLCCEGPCCCCCDDPAGAARSAGLFEAAAPATEELAAEGREDEDEDEDADVCATLLLLGALPFLTPDADTSDFAIAGGAVLCFFGERLEDADVPSGGCESLKSGGRLPWLLALLLLLLLARAARRGDAGAGYGLLSWC